MVRNAVFIVKKFPTDRIRTCDLQFEPLALYHEPPFKALAPLWECLAYTKEGDLFAELPWGNLVLVSFEFCLCKYLSFQELMGHFIIILKSNLQIEWTLHLSSCVSWFKYISYSNKEDYWAFLSQFRLHTEELWCSS